MLHRLIALIAVCCGLIAAATAATVNVYMFAFNFTTDATLQTIVQPTIHVGDTLHFINVDTVFSHCTTSCAGMSESWASGIKAPGGTFDYTFTHVGNFGFFCCLHGFDNGNGTGGGMAGMVTVLPAANVTGTVMLQNFSGAMPMVTIEIRNPGSTTALNTYNVVPAADGSYSIPAPAAGTYDITFKASHWLRKVDANVNVTGTGASGVNANLFNGDVNGDNAITVSDFVALRAAFGSSSGAGNWNPEADLDGNGSVTIGDFITLRSNFGRSGDQ